MEKKESPPKNNQKELPYMILDTSFFIKLTSLDLTKNKYFTTQYIVNEIRDPKARDFYQLNKNFIEIKNPSKESIKKVSKFAQESNDLTYLSIADLSVMALAYETIKNIGKLDKLNKKPLSYNIVSQDKLIEEAKKQRNNNENQIKEEKEENNIINLNEEDDDDEGWITPENLYTKLDEMNGIHEIKNKKKKIDNKDKNKNEDKIDDNKINIKMNLEDDIKENDENNKINDDINVFVNILMFLLILLILLYKMFV